MLTVLLSFPVCNISVLSILSRKRKKRKIVPHVFPYLLNQLCASRFVFLQELSCKDQVRVAEVSRVRVELQEQIGHLEAERTAQVGLKEKISALEREIKGLLFVSPIQF